MCGRYALTVEPDSLFGVFQAVPDERSGGAQGLYGGDPVRPRYNIGPTVTVPVVRLRVDRASDGADRADGGESGQSRPVRELEPMRWGLVPSWAKDVSVGNRMFNARAESLADKPAFRTALHRRRCLIPATGYYEWQKLPQADGGATRTGAAEGRKAPAKQPYYLTPQDGSTMAFAGLWEYWRSPEGEPLVSMTIITTEAVGALREIHDRMPLILPASEWDAWLDSEVDPATLLSPPDAALVDALEIRPVGPAVGNVRNDDPALVERDPHPAVAGPGGDRGTVVGTGAADTAPPALFDNPA
ncbi:SOS response-associated peptidase [Nakamurella leprariae]|uniref:Abasic site processing protein n=1 Tax=Nakamurella leprariae TaxID=2803911 RepID=A0A938YER3_9ACTN|nr:SOS response-associated peptidase [Nakamurella leprariae]MBM9468201.1 SOS response-associated peptidase [Nakamurella leprariae]